jgi:DNA-binding LacI/PurR family transcriptional regulator
MAGKRAVTLKDIAERTGFSINTVSVALRGGKKIPRVTREVILGAAHELDYMPNALARSLARQSSRTIGLVIANLQNPILTLCAEHIERRLEARGYQTVLRSTNFDLARERQAVDSLRQLQVEGLLIYPSDQRELGELVALRRAGLPIVSLGGGPGGPLDLVAVDDQASTEAVTGHLIAAGHRRIGFLDTSRNNGNFRKIAGFVASHARAGIPLDPRLVYCPADTTRPEVGYDRALRFLDLDPPATAVVCSSDVLAVGMLSWCRRHGVDVPGRLSIAGLDDIEMSAYLTPPLTTARYSVEEISRAAVDRLLDLLAARDSLPEPVSVMVRAELIVRQSTRAIGPAPAPR